MTKFGTGHRQQVNLDQVDSNGASNNGYGNSISQDGQSQTSAPYNFLAWGSDSGP